MKAVIQPWGDSAAVRIPDMVMRAAHLNIGQELDVRVEKGVLVFTPLRLPSHDLASLLDRISDDNLHGEVSFCDAVGREGW